MRVRDGKKLAHEGIKVEFVGSIGACAVVSFETNAPEQRPCTGRALLRPRPPP